MSSNFIREVLAIHKPPMLAMDQKEKKNEEKKNT